MYRLFLSVNPIFYCNLDRQIHNTCKCKVAAIKELVLLLQQNHNLLKLSEKLVYIHCTQLFSNWITKSWHFVAQMVNEAFTASYSGLKGILSFHHLADSKVGHSLDNFTYCNHHIMHSYSNHSIHTQFPFNGHYCSVVLYTPILFPVMLFCAEPCRSMTCAR